MASTIDNQQALAIHGGTPVRDSEARPWPRWPQHGDGEREGLLRVLESGKWWYGDEVARFERRFAEIQDAAYCVSCTNGATAAEIAMQALGVRPGDEVIVPPYTFVATAMSVARIGAIPIFADVNDTWCIDPVCIEAAITEKTRAIMPVHFGASLADMDAINAIAKKHNLFVIEDACHSWGAKWRGKGTGALGDCGVFSFQNSKNVTAAEGGCIVTDNEALADQCRSITNCGRIKGGEWFEHHVLGTNARITEFQAVMLNAQLDRIYDLNAKRSTFAAKIDACLANLDGLTPQPVLEGVSHRIYHLYDIRYDAEAVGCSRDAFVEAARAEGLPLGAGYAVPLYKQPFLKKIAYDYSKVSCPVAEDLCDKSAMWLHHSILLGDEKDYADVIAIFDKVHANASRLHECGKK